VAVRRLRDFDPERGRLEAWLRGIALNVLRNLARREKRREEVERSVGEGGAPPNESGSSRDERPGAELAEEIAFVLSGLSERYREVLQAKYQEGLAVQEIAGRTGETPKAVESLLARARVAFREAFERRDRAT
jgi:RNA polymerase sigma-70 factor (ECF subfamily)